jgi:hypothetical protein
MELAGKVCENWHAKRGRERLRKLARENWQGNSQKLARKIIKEPAKVLPIFANFANTLANFSTGTGELCKTTAFRHFCSARTQLDSGLGRRQQVT